MDASFLSLTAAHVRTGREAELRAAARGGAVVAVCRGVWADRERWEAALPEERMRLRAYAHSRTCEQPPVHAFETAAALHDLPLWGAEDARVHVLDPDPRPARSRPGVFRHTGALPGDQVVVRHGLLATSLERTLFDVLRTARAEVAIGCLDAALRAQAWSGHGRYDAQAAEGLRDRVTDRLRRAPGARGIRQARFLVALGDGRAQLPGESVSRLWMHLLGAPEPELQHEVPLAAGRRAFLDFAWPRLRRFGEFDGDGKYLAPELTGGRSVREVLREQRRREADIVAATGWTPVRWGSERLAGLSAFGGFLRAQGMLP